MGDKHGHECACDVLAKRVQCGWKDSGEAAQYLAGCIKSVCAFRRQLTQCLLSAPFSDVSWLLFENVFLWLRSTKVVVWKCVSVCVNVWISVVFVFTYLFQHCQTSTWWCSGSHCCHTARFNLWAFGKSKLTVGVSANGCFVFLCGPVINHQTCPGCNLAIAERLHRPQQS